LRYLRDENRLVYALLASQANQPALDDGDVLVAKFAPTLDTRRQRLVGAAMRNEIADDHRALFSHEGLL
jgi:hypothetical protein